MAIQEKEDAIQKLNMRVNELESQGIQGVPLGLSTSCQHAFNYMQYCLLKDFPRCTTFPEYVGVPFLCAVLSMVIFAMVE